jgi:hypothetical protein
VLFSFIKACQPAQTTASEKPFPGPKLLLSFIGFEIN